MVMISDYFGPLMSRHSFQYSPKMLKDELRLVVVIVIAITSGEQLKAFLHCVRRQNHSHGHM